ncbi:MAG: phosphate-starvation-inducible PsiE family protein [Chloroflexota bacterium]
MHHEDASTTAVSRSRLRHPGTARILEGLEHSERVVYIGVGVIFLVMAIAMLAHSVIVFINEFSPDGVPTAVVATVNDLLLVIIIMEVLRTVLSYLENPRISLRPFLFVAAISATRQILSIGAHMSVAGDTIDPERFQQLMTDLLVNALAILAIALAVFLVSRSDQSRGQARPIGEPVHHDPRHEPPMAGGLPAPRPDIGDLGPDR